MQRRPAPARQQALGDRLGERDAGVVGRDDGAGALAAEGALEPRRRQAGGDRRAAADADRVARDDEQRAVRVVEQVLAGPRPLDAGAQQQGTRTVSGAPSAPSASIALARSPPPSRTIRAATVAVRSSSAGCSSTSCSVLSTVAFASTGQTSQPVAPQQAGRAPTGRLGRACGIGT
jgi:hypothetical protein